MAAKFVPIQKYEVDKAGNEVKDENGNSKKIDLYKGTTFEEVVAFLAEKGTDKDRAEFKKNCYLMVKKVPTGRKDKKGKEIKETVMANGKPVLEKSNKLNWLYAKRKFFEKFAPEYIKEKKPSKADLIANW